MQVDDFEKFCELLMALGERFDKKLTPTTLKLDFAAFSRFTIEQIEAAVTTWYTTGRFFPRPVELIELLEGAPDDRATKAWDLFVAAVRAGGSWKSVYANDARLLQTIQVVYGSWPQACEMLPAVADPMFAAHRKQFIASFSTAHDGGTHYLMGVSEAHNRNAPKLLPVGRETFTASVVVIGERVTLRECEFSAATGSLTEQSIRQLRSATNLRLLAA